MTPGSKLPCPFLHSCCLGRVVLVKRPLVVTEAGRGDNSYRPTVRGHQELIVMKECSYLMLDSKNVHFVSYADQHCSEEPSANIDHVSKSEGPSSNIDRDCLKVLLSKNEKPCSKVNQHCVKLPETKTEEPGPSICVDRTKENGENINGEICNADVSVLGINKKSALHKHTNEDGVISFCRDVKCLSASKHSTTEHATTEQNKQDHNAKSNIFTPKFVVKGKKRKHINKQYVSSNDSSDKAVVTEGTIGMKHGDCDVEMDADVDGGADTAACSQPATSILDARDSHSASLSSRLGVPDIGIANMF